MNALALLTRFGVAKASAGGGGGVSAYFIQGLPSLVSISFNHQFGWEFTANADLSLTGLRLWGNTSAEETLRVWRVSDTTLLASTTLVPTPGEWSEVSFGSPVALANGVNYIISTRRTTGASRALYRASPAGTTFDPNVTYVNGRLIAADTFPTSTAANVYGIIDGIYEA